MVTPAQIRAGRALLDITQGELSDAVGISKTALVAIESGASTPRIATASAIQRALEVRGVAFSENGVFLMQKINVWERLAESHGRPTHEADEREEQPEPGKERRGQPNPAPGETVAEYWRRADATAKAITRAGDRRRGKIP
jgi:DNA-binding XRE family transcriptional regulator